MILTWIFAITYILICILSILCIGFGIKIYREDENGIIDEIHKKKSIKCFKAALILMIIGVINLIIGFIVRINL